MNWTRNEYISHNYNFNEQNKLPIHFNCSQIFFNSSNHINNFTTNSYFNENTFRSMNTFLLSESNSFFYFNLIFNNKIRPSPLPLLNSRSNTRNHFTIRNNSTDMTKIAPLFIFFQVSLSFINSYFYLYFILFLSLFYSYCINSRRIKRVKSNISSILINCSHRIKIGVLSFNSPIVLLNLLFKSS